jgi:hypothetical protein
LSKERRVIEDINYVFDNSLCKLTVCARITKCDVRLEEGDSQCGQIIFKEFEKAVEIYSQSSSSFYEVNSVVYIPYFGKLEPKISNICVWKGGRSRACTTLYFHLRSIKKQLVTLRVKEKLPHIFISRKSKLWLGFIYVYHDINPPFRDARLNTSTRCILRTSSSLLRVCRTKVDSTRGNTTNKAIATENRPPCPLFSTFHDHDHDHNYNYDYPSSSILPYYGYLSSPKLGLY